MEIHAYAFWYLIVRKEKIMTKDQIDKIVKNTKRGTIHTIMYGKQLTTRAGTTDTYEKRTTTQGRFGVDYSNLASVVNARNIGALPIEAGPLPAGTSWHEYPYYIKGKAGLQLRVARANSGYGKTEYFKNGQKINKAEAVAACLASEFPKYKEGSTPPPIFNIGIEKIISIK